MTTVVSGPPLPEPLLVQPENSTNPSDYASEPERTNPSDHTSEPERTNPSDHTSEPERSGGGPFTSVAELISNDFSSSGMELSGTAADASRSGIELSRTSVEGQTYRKRSRDVHWLDESTTNGLDESTTNQGPISTSGSFNSLAAMVQPNGGDTSINCERQQNRNKHKEAALFIREGENDAKIYNHPKDKWATWAYALIHYQVYYMIHFIVCIFLMLLAFAEMPFVGQPELDDDQKKILVSIHGVLELILLSLLGVNVILYIVWFRLDFIRHRILLITIILVVMYMEALTVVIRQQNHIRITRVLRPLFLLDTHYMGSVRRVSRQIVKILKPILDVLLLLIFFILLFGLFGYLFFAEINPDYFSDYSTSCLSLFITASTANNPDVMMEAYAQHGATPIFFVIYLLVTLYLASNMLLAVVYASFSKADKKKFKELFCHKRDSLRQAFQVLTEDRVVQFHDFLLLMQHYRPRMPEWQVFCIFKSLNKDPHKQYDELDEGDFLRFYEVMDFKWSQVNKDDKLKWYTQLPSKLVKPFEIISKVVSHRLYKFLVGLVAFVNFVFLIVVASRIQDVKERYEEFHKVLPGTIFFLIIYILDIIFSIVGHGPYEYFRKFWNLADVIVILISFISAIISIYHVIWVVILPLKLLRLIRLKRCYRDIMNTMVELVPRLLSVFILMLIIYYCFAIIGMEFLYMKVEQGCCTDALYDVGSFYKDSLNITDPSDISHNVYYLNNFDNILRSYATLFILMVVNNWYVIMEGFASEVHHQAKWPTRIYFMVFYIITLVLLQVIIAFIVEAFLLKIQAAIERRICLEHPKNPNCGCARREEKKKKKVFITLVEEDLAKLQYEMAYMDSHCKGQQKWINKQIRTWQRNHINVAGQLEVHFIGSRSYTKEDVHILHYREEIALWRKERPNFRGRSSLELEQLKKLKDKRNIRQFCHKIGKNILDFILD